MIIQCVLYRIHLIIGQINSEVKFKIFSIIFRIVGDITNLGSETINIFLENHRNDIHFKIKNFYTTELEFTLLSYFSIISNTFVN